MIPSECGCSRIAAEAAKVDLGWLQNVASQAKSHPDRLSIATLASRVLAPRPRRYRHYFGWPAASLDPGSGRRRSAAIGSRPLQDQNHNGPSPVGLGEPPVPTRGAPGAVRRTGGGRRLHDLAERKANDLHDQANAFRNLSISLARDDAQNLHPRAGSEIALAE